VEVVTEQATFQAQVVVAADGSRSLVRQRLNWNQNLRLARLLEVLTPESRDQRAFEEGVAVFDFSQIKAGLQGYYWDFPSLIDGRPVMNRGMFDSRARPERPRIPLKRSLAAALADRTLNLSDYQLKGHPIHWFSRSGVFSRPRLLLAGDAAGVDPLLGEGISFALGYGEVAAAAILAAFAHQNFGFGDYKQRILRHPLLSRLPARTALARFIYRLKYPWQIDLLWRMTTLLIHIFSWYRPDTISVKTCKDPAGHDFGAAAQ
jgi:flavin-dependent dehydrogenase